MQHGLSMSFFFVPRAGASYVVGSMTCADSFHISFSDNCELVYLLLFLFFSDLLFQHCPLPEDTMTIVLLLGSGNASHNRQAHLWGGWVDVNMSHKVAPRQRKLPRTISFNEEADLKNGAGSFVVDQSGGLLIHL